MTGVPETPASRLECGTTVDELRPRLSRLPDWQCRLTDYLRTVARRGFAYGRHDCATFTAGCIAAMTGTDPMRGFRGYRTLAAGLRKAGTRGYADHIAVVATLFDECLPSFARAGDIAVVEGATFPSLGIVQGARIYVIGPHGIGTVPLDAARRAFRV